MCVSYTQWLPKSSHQVKGPHVDIECKQVTYGLFGASRHVYGHHNAACRTGTRLKRRHCAIPVSSCVVRRTRVVAFLFGAFSREAEVLVAQLSDHAAANVDCNILWISTYITFNRNINFRKWINIFLMNTIFL